MSVVSLVKNKAATYGEVLQKYLDEMTEEERNAPVTSAIVFGVGDKGGFYSIMKQIGILECLGLVEQLKYFLILESLEEDYDDDEE